MVKAAKAAAAATEKCASQMTEHARIAKERGPLKGKALEAQMQRIKEEGRFCDAFCLVVKNDTEMKKWRCATAQHPEYLFTTGGDDAEDRVDTREELDPYLLEKMAMLDALRPEEPVPGLGHLTAEGYAICGRLHPTVSGKEFTPYIHKA